MTEIAANAPNNRDPVAPVAASSPERSLDGTLVHGLAWTGALKWTAQIISWLSTLLVVRLLTPADYGIMGMATLYLGLIQMLSEFGVGAAVITLRQLDRKQVAQLNMLAVVFGVGGFLLSGAAAFPLGVFFHSPRLPAVVVVVGFGFVVSSFGVVPSSLLSRDLQFKQLSLIGGVQAIAASGATLLLAWLGLGYWALTLGGLFGLAIFSAAVVARRPHAFARPRLRAIRSAMTFSGHIIVARISWYVSSNADFLVIGRVLGQSALGLYTVAWTLANVAIEKVTAIVGQVTPAVFAASQTDFERMRRYVLSITEMLALVTFPAALGLALVAEDFTRAILGDKWLMAIGALRLLALYAIIRSVTPLLPQVLNVVGDSFYGMVLGVVGAIVMPLTFYFAARYGIVGVAAAWLLVHPLVLLALFVRVFRRIDMQVAPYLRALWPAVSGCIGMAMVVTAIGQALPSTLPVALRLSCEVAGGALSYFGVLMLLHGPRLLSRVRTLRANLAA